MLNYEAGRQPQIGNIDTEVETIKELAVSRLDGAVGSLEYSTRFKGNFINLVVGREVYGMYRDGVLDTDLSLDKLASTEEWEKDGYSCVVWLQDENGNDTTDAISIYLQDGGPLELAAPMTPLGEARDKGDEDDSEQLSLGQVDALTGLHVEDLFDEVRTLMIRGENDISYKSENKIIDLTTLIRTSLIKARSRDDLYPDTHAMAIASSLPKEFEWDELDDNLTRYFVHSASGAMLALRKKMTDLETADDVDVSIAMCPRQSYSLTRNLDVTTDGEVITYNTKQYKDGIRTGKVKAASLAEIVEVRRTLQDDRYSRTY